MYHLCFHLLDKIPERNNLKEETFILAHGFGSFCPYWVASIVCVLWWGRNVMAEANVGQSCSLWQFEWERSSIDSGYEHFVLSWWLCLGSSVGQSCWKKYVIKDRIWVFSSLSAFPVHTLLHALCLKLWALIFLRLRCLQLLALPPLHNRLLFLWNNKTK